MQDVIWQLLGVPIDDGRIITASADANRKLQWLNGFARKHLTGTEAEKMTGILEHIEVLRTERNFIMHASWCTHTKTGDPCGMSVKEKAADPTEIVMESFPLYRMEAIWNGIDMCKFALMAWANSHAEERAKPPPYPMVAAKL
jgi:hypothetical protein